MVHASFTLHSLRTNTVLVIALMYSPFSSTTGYGPAYSTTFFYDFIQRHIAWYGGYVRRDGVAQLIAFFAGASL